MILTKLPAVILERKLLSMPGLTPPVTATASRKQSVQDQPLINHIPPGGRSMQVASVFPSRTFHLGAKENYELHLATQAL